MHMTVAVAWGKRSQISPVSDLGPMEIGQSFTYLEIQEELGWELYWEHWIWFGTLEEPGHPRRKMLRSGAVSREAAVGPAGMSTTEPEELHWKQELQISVLSLVLGSPPSWWVTLIVLGLPTDFLEFQDKSNSKFPQVREAYQCVLGVSLLLLLLLLWLRLLERRASQIHGWPLGGILTLEGGAGVAGEEQPRASWRCQV